MPWKFVCDFRFHEILQTIIRQIMKGIYIYIYITEIFYMFVHEYSHTHTHSHIYKREKETHVYVQGDNTSLMSVLI